MGVMFSMGVMLSMGRMVASFLTFTGFTSVRFAVRCFPWNLQVVGFLAWHLRVGGFYSYVHTVLQRVFV